MADGNGAGEDAEDTDELLSTELDEEVSGFGLAPASMPRDHCDLLLDAIDAQLSRLQTQSYSQGQDENWRREDLFGTALFSRSQSLSKDTGLGSTANDKAASGLSMAHSECHGLASAKASGSREEERSSVPPVAWERAETEGPASRREQCRWRLERLLGSAEGGAGGGLRPSPDSDCTEDLATRFTEEMLDLPKRGQPGAPRDGARILGKPKTVPAPAPEPPSTSSDTGVLTESQLSLDLTGTRDNKDSVRHLAGVPVRSFDMVTIDSDLDSVRTDQIRQHLHSTLNCRPALRTWRGNGSCGRQPVRKQHHRRKYAFSSDNDEDDDEDDVEEINEECILSRDHPKGAKHSNNAPQRRRRAHRGKRNGNMDSEREEDMLRIKRAQLCEVEQSLTDLLQQRKCTVQDLERLRAETEIESRSLEASLRDSREEADSTRSQLRRLQAQRDCCLQEVSGLEEELAALHRHGTALQEGVDIHRQMASSSMSVLEREEMDRLLEGAKSELFAEQRRFRHTLDSMQEKLDEAHQESEQREEEARMLKERCAGLEAKLAETIRQREEQKERELQDRVGALERIVAQQELLLLGMQEERSALHMELCSLREEHATKLTHTQEQAHREKEQELGQLKVQLTAAHEQELQQVSHQAEEAKSDALREQALSHTQHTDSLRDCIQLKEKELRRLRETLEQQEELMRRHEEELREEIKDTVHRAVEQEVQRWEVQKEEALQEQRGEMEEQGREALERARKEAERERRNALALQNKVVELQTRRQELESEWRVQQREQSSVQAAMCRAMREEHQAELQHQRRHTEQEGQREMLWLKQALQRSEEELQALQAALAERERVQQGAAAQQEQQHRRWAQQLQAECQSLGELLEHSRLTAGTVHLPHMYTHSPTVTQAVQSLQPLRQQLQLLIAALQSELDSQKHSTQQLARDKDLELCIQREQMVLEKEKALDSLKERLIQEHIEELSSLNCAQLREGGAEAGGVASSLRRQLQDKDEELRQVQRSMGQWKEKTTARLARKFEEELTSELERRAPRDRAEQQRKLERLDGEMRRLTAQCSDYGDVRSASSPSLHVTAPPRTPGTQDLASYKLLRHLQSRIRQLHAENQVPSCSPTHLGSTPGELAGSYLETIAPAQESSQSWSRSGVGTAHS